MRDTLDVSSRRKGSSKALVQDALNSLDETIRLVDGKRKAHNAAVTAVSTTNQELRKALSQGDLNVPREILPRQQTKPTPPAPSEQGLMRENQLLKMSLIGEMEARLNLEAMLSSYTVPSQDLELENAALRKEINAKPCSAADLCGAVEGLKLDNNALRTDMVEFLGLS